MACSDRPPQAASPRDGLAELERSRQQVQLLTSREAELQQEVTRLQAENRRLTRSREALMLELDPAGLAEENRNLLQEKKQMLLELQRVARDNQRLAQSEALARAELEAFVCPSFWTGRAIDSRRVPPCLPTQPAPYFRCGSQSSMGREAVLLLLWVPRLRARMNQRLSQRMPRKTRPRKSRVLRWPRRRRTLQRPLRVGTAACRA
ncbi:unnamed protein product [Effrenium voratum]|nr:unnamed protein product [Effrenium voratum]